jgi:hypothetical protein
MTKISISDDISVECVENIRRVVSADLKTDCVASVQSLDGEAVVIIEAKR